MRIIFLGTSNIARPALNALAKSKHELLGVITKPNRLTGRGRKLFRCPIAILASELGYIVHQPTHVIELADELRSMKPELFVIMAFGQILPKAILDIAPLGTVNVHPSLLPALRGAAPIQRAIIQGFKYTGVTTLYLDQGIDTGDIILQQPLEINSQDTAGSLSERLSWLSADLLIRTIKLIEKDQAPRTHQNHSQATHASLLRKTDGKINWSNSAHELNCLVRGVDPWPGAYTLLAGKQLKLFNPIAIDSQTKNFTLPGTIISIPEKHNDYLYIACGTGVLGLGELQISGKRRLAAREFLHGTRLATGIILGK